MQIGKRIEIGLKGGASRLVRTFAEQAPREPSPPYARILFIRHGGIGDMILSLPVLRAARSRFPAAQIDVLCGRVNVGPLLDSGLADHIDFYEKQPIRTLRLAHRMHRRGYDYILNLLPYPSFTFGMLARMIGPRAIRTASDPERFSYFYNRLRELPAKQSMHMLDRMFLLAADVVGDAPARPSPPWVDHGPEIGRQADEIWAQALHGLGARREPARIGLLHLAAGLRRREWPLEKCIALVRRAGTQYEDRLEGWLVITTPQQPEDAATLVREVDSPAVAALPPQADFRVMMEIVRRAHVVVTPDTSIAHAASAMGTPIVDLMIGENVTTWAPVGVPHRIVASDDLFSLHELPVERVMEALGALLEELQS